jgi:Phosphoesterase family
MGYWTKDDLPFYCGLARTFPLADRWFSSCLGPTFPNRRFLISGTAHGLMDDLPWDVVDYPEAGTIFDVLTGHGIDWVNYHNVRHRLRVQPDAGPHLGAQAGRMVDLDAAPAFAEPPKLPEPALRWGSWSQPRQRRARGPRRRRAVAADR